jgi:predicted transcriptional regulator
MRISLDLEPDVAARLEQLMQATDDSLNVAVNGALRRGLVGIDLQTAPIPPFKVQPHSFGFKPGTDLDSMNRPADQLEAEEYFRECERFHESIQTGLADAEAGRLVSDEDLGARLDDELGPPD